MTIGALWTLLTLLVPPSLCFNHWMVTEDGKIEYQLTSPFNLRQPFNLLAFLQQEERVSILRELKDELLEYRNEFGGYSGYESFDASFREQVPECRNVKLLSAYDLYISTVLPLEHKKVRFADHLDPSTSVYPGEPFCANSPLNFSPYALEHLPGVQQRRSLVAPPEKSVLASVSMRMEVFGSLVHHALEKNATSWVLLDLATLYWRARGNPYNGVECIRRALHYSPQHSMDIALLNLANILHRSQHSSDAVVPLKVATSLSPNMNVLHYTLGNVYAALGQANNSMASFKHSLDLEPSSETIRSMYVAALCELRLEETLLERSHKLDLTQKKLDKFYENMELLQQSQVTVDGSPLSEDDFQIAGMKRRKPTAVKNHSKRKARKGEEAGKRSKSKLKSGKEEKEEEGEADSGEPVVDGSAVKVALNKSKSVSYLEQALEDAALEKKNDTHSNESLPSKLANTDSLAAKNDSVIPVPEKKRRSKLRLILRPLSEEESCCSECFTMPQCLGPSGSTTSVASAVSTQCCPVRDPDITSRDHICAADDLCTCGCCFNTSLSTGIGQDRLHQRTIQADQDMYDGISKALDCVLSDGRKGNCLKSHQPIKLRKLESYEMHQEQAMPGGLETQASIGPIRRPKSPPRIVIKTVEDSPLTRPSSPKTEPKRKPSDELSMFQHLDDSTGTSTVIMAERVKKAGQVDIVEYPSTYRSLKFLPYNPLPVQLEEVVFPDRSHPLALYDDPYWPSKAECLDLVSALRWTGMVPGFTGTFLTPEARGADVEKLFTPVPLNLPSYMRQKPRCTDIVELPYSMAAMDHLEPIMYRTTLRINKQTGEKGLRKVLTNAVTGSLDVARTFEESAERAYAAMLKNGPNWVLFNIASLYWRVVGDPASAIECLRRAVHFAPTNARDVGYIGLANVLHRQGFLNEAVIVARAALDTSGNSPVGHYTLAGIYLSLRDHVASTLHLRAALHIQPMFNHALSALKLLRCSLKFKEEQGFLKRKLEQEQEEMMKRHEAMLLKDLQRAMKGGVPVKIQEHPAMILEKTDPPEIPEMKVEPMLPSMYTGQDAIRYLTKLALIQRRGRKEKERAETEKEKEEVKTRNTEKQVAEKRDRVSELQSSGSEVPVGETVNTSRESVSSSKSTNKSELSEPSHLDPHPRRPPGTYSDDHDESDPSDGRNGISPNPSTSNQSPQIEEANPKTESTQQEEEQSESPVQSDPQDAAGATTPSESGKDRQPLSEPSSSCDTFVEATSSDVQDYSDEKDVSPSALESKGTITVQNPTEGGVQERGKCRDTSDGEQLNDLEMSDKEPESNSESSKTNPEVEAGKAAQEENAKPNSRHRVQSQRNQNQSKGKSPTIGRQGRSQTLDMSSVKVGSDDDDFDFDPELEKLIAETAKTINEQKTPVPQRVPAKIKSRNDIREEETRKRFPGIRPWPTLEECMQSPLPKYIVFTSTWLSVTAKGVKVKEHIDFVSPLEHYPLLPYCNNDFGNSPKTLDHLTGMNGPPLMPYKAEKGLQEVLRNLDGTPRSLEEMATRIKLAMDKNSTSWVLSNLAALYWRIVGQGKLAIKCLRHSLYYSDNSNKDVALVSLANVLYRLGYDMDAAACIQMSLEVGGFENSPTLVVSHFTMANIFAAQGYLLEASGFYESTLQFQPEFQPAADRLRIVRCLIHLTRERQEQEKKKKS